MRKFEEYVTAFMCLGSWFAILVMILLSGQFATKALVVKHILVAIILGVILSVAVVSLFVGFKYKDYPKSVFMVISLAALVANVGVFTYNNSKVMNYSRVPSVVIEKGIKRSQQKTFYKGRYLKLDTEFGIMERTVPKELFDAFHVGDSVYVGLFIGKLGFAKMEF